ncbi:maleylpyruvate isomerase family mycothiol-dependent enzyme [Nonomuraea sp. B19D2]|uniref:maleylpyruvate isomerase family mycothiol-dependent enzyme n=1 Tax=Nonomuraea sp. B19D2 TaxID=3159561 RepID=UPI0032DB2828
MTALEWVAEGTRLFDDRLAALSDTEMDMASALPGWSRRHVVAHVAHNARALVRLLRWARTGEETPMYASRQARDAEIAEGARLEAPALRALYAASRDELAEADHLLPTECWSAWVRTVQGRMVRAEEIRWMRTREVWIHAVDLSNGASFADFPADLLDALIDDVTAWRSRQARSSGLLIAPTDRNRQWRIEGSPTQTLTGTAAELAAVLTGRAPGPDLGRWL